MTTESIETADLEPVESTEPEVTAEVPSEGSEAPPIPEAAPEGHIDWDTRINEWGGENTIQDALAIYNGLADEEGVAQLFIEAGRSLGLGITEMQALISGQPVAAEPEEDESLDEVMTRREFLDELDKRVIAPQQQQAAQRAQEAQAEHLRSHIGSTLDSLAVPDDDAVRASVLSLANTFLTGESDEEIATAIKQGYAAFDASVKAEAERYVASKQTARDGSPQPVSSGGAGAPGGEPVKPVTFAEHGQDVMEIAIQRARARLAG
jgi:hypothetical protein